jgi:hypothetical protein
MKRLFLLAILAGAIWLGFDLFGSHRGDLRRFDPNAVGRLETEMWRSYYSGERVSLFNQLARTLREQYGMGYTQSYAVAVQAARAAFTSRSAMVERTDWSNRESMGGGSGVGACCEADKAPDSAIPRGFRANHNKSSEPGKTSSIMIAIGARVSAD